MLRALRHWRTVAALSRRLNLAGETVARWDRWCVEAMLIAELAEEAVDRQIESK